MTRFTNHTEGGFRTEAGKPPMQANRMRCAPWRATWPGCYSVLDHAVPDRREHARQRPGRSYPRKSRKPASKWKSSNKSAKTKQACSLTPHNPARNDNFRLSLM